MTCRGHKPVGMGIGLMIVVIGSISPIFAQSAQADPPSAEQMAKSNLTYKVIAAEGGGYGYDIYSDKKLFIHQPTIPGQPGLAGFRRRSDAEKIAELIIKKLKNKEMPPSVTTEELKKLKVID